MKGFDPHKAAAREAWEEAGVRGVTRPAPVGLYHYDKERPPEAPIACAVQVFALSVDEVKKTFPEAGQRRRKWFDPQEAANRVAEPGLRDLLAGFAPPLRKT